MILRVKVYQGIEDKLYLNILLKYFHRVEVNLAIDLFIELKIINIHEYSIICIPKY